MTGTNQRAVVLAGALVAAALLGAAGCETNKAAAEAQEMASGRQEAERLAREAEQLADEGKVDDAIATYRRSLDQSQALPSVWNNLGVLLLQKRNYIDAVTVFNVAADKAPSDPRPMENLALAYHQTGHEEKALEYYIQALSRSPNRVESLRGAVLAGKLLTLTDRPALERVNRGMMVEPDQAWRRFMVSEKVRIEAVMAPDPTAAPVYAAPPPPTGHPEH